jgi:hypothetical protein
MSNNKKFCKMCFDAGKLDYAAHFLRDRQGVVTCPTLKGIKCRFCSGVGHTPKYCPVLKSKTEKEIRAQQFQKAKEEVVKKEEAKKEAPVNIFDMLNDDDDDEVEEEPVMTYADKLNNGVPLEIPKLIRNSPQPMIKKKAPEVKRTSWYEDSSDEEDEESVYDGDF